MKIALLNDIHFGARSDSDRVAAHQEKFYDKVFFPYIDEHNIKTVFMLGDVFDRRKYINFRTLDGAYRIFFSKAIERGMDIHVLAGNHDIYHGNSTKVNSIDLLIDFPSVKRYTDVATEVSFDNLHVCVCPWLTQENRQASLSVLHDTNCPVVFGHFDINGFEMNVGVVCETGEDPVMFSKFDMVLTGHYHRKMSGGNIHYLGSQYDMDWADYGVPKYFHVIDSESYVLTPIQNPYTLFSKLYYKNGFDNQVIDIEGKYVKVVILEKKDPYLFDVELNKLRLMRPESLATTDDIVENISVEQQHIASDKTTLNIIEEYMDNVTTVSDDHKKNVLGILTDLYTEANTIGVLS